jgi:ribosome modulation factor
MNVLDENISVIQRQFLWSWRIPVRHIGYDAGRNGMTDEEIVPFQHLRGRSDLLAYLEQKQKGRIQWQP